MAILPAAAAQRGPRVTAGQTQGLTLWLWIHSGDGLPRDLSAPEGSSWQLDHITRAVGELVCSSTLPCPLGANSTQCQD